MRINCYNNGGANKSEYIQQTKTGNLLKVKLVKWRSQRRQLNYQITMHFKLNNIKRH